MILNIEAKQSDNGKKLTVNDLSDLESTLITGISSVTFEISRYNYETNDYTPIGSATLNESYSTQKDMEYYITVDGTNMNIVSKQGLGAIIGEYSEEIIKDGIWKIAYKTSVQNDTEDFLFHYPYESKLGVYQIFSDLPNLLGEDLVYNKNVESALLKRAILNSLKYSAEFGQLEIIEEFDLALKDLLND